MTRSPGGLALRVAGTGALGLGGFVVLTVFLVSSSMPTAASASAEALGIPDVALEAYINASAQAHKVAKKCEVRWSIVAALGAVESGHGTFGGAVADEKGDVRPHIVGIALDGSNGTARIPDSDDGLWDFDSTWDRAVGPMQFIPSSWRSFRRDGNADRKKDPHNIFDATLGAVAHLCLSSPGNYEHRPALERAIWSYNHSESYVQTVMSFIDYYDAFVIKDGDVVGSSGAYTLPIARELFEGLLPLSPHHDYPAVDLAVATGTRIYAVHGGTVIAVTRSGACGYGVIVSGLDGYEYTYCHGSKLEVRAGQRIAAGELIMASGNSGNSSGPHLHLQIETLVPPLKLCPQSLLMAWYERVMLSPANASSAGCTS